MSKYVRTDRGIIYVGDLIKDEYGNYCDPKNYETDMEVSNEYIIEEADSIEELVDEFIWDKLIIRFEDKTHFTFVNDDFVFELNESILKEGIFGAIWIVDDNGAPILKSVSKMINTEGDLRLLWLS